MEELKESIELGVIGVLTFMSFLSVAVAVERWLFFRRVKVDSYSTKQELEIDLTRGLHIIATVASNAPYVGLLGTVLGIMLTFQVLGSKGFMDTREVMTGLALALKATAVGLIVAIPSVVLYNLLLRKVRVLLSLWEARFERDRI